MRRLVPTLRSKILHGGQSVLIVGAALLAMAGAPMALPEEDVASGEAPTAPPVAAVATPAGPVMREIVFSAPVHGFAVNSPFGMRRMGGTAPARPHEGVDIAAPIGTSVYATTEGRVIRTGYDAGGYGRFVEVRHPNGMTSLYGHLSRIDVASGDEVAAGARLGLVGNTGRSTGPHLHFEIRRRDTPVNPVRVMGQAFPVRAKVPA